LKLETSTTPQMKGLELLFPKNTNLLVPVYTEKKLQRTENCKKCENRKSAVIFALFVIQLFSAILNIFDMLI
jgi:hypothetical protein